MKMEQRKNSWWVNTILLVLDFPIAYFLIYVSIGLEEHVIAIYEESPCKVFFTKVCVTFFLIYVLNIVLIALIRFMIRFKFNYINFMLKNGMCLLFMVSLIAIYKLVSYGYI